jgi:hypothetical protein
MKIDVEVLNSGMLTSKCKPLARRYILNLVQVTDNKNC